MLQVLKACCFGLLAYLAFGVLHCQAVLLPRMQLVKNCASTDCSAQGFWGLGLEAYPVHWFPILDGAKLDAVGDIEKKANNPVLLLELHDDAGLNTLQNARNGHKQRRLQRGNVVCQLFNIPLQSFEASLACFRCTSALKGKRSYTCEACAGFLFW